MALVDLPRTVLKSTVAGVILYAVYLLVLLTVPYLAFEKNTDFLLTKQLIYHLDWWRWSFYIHIFSSPVIILSGLFQFSRKMIRNHPKWHRRLGKIYLVFVLFISGPSALIMSFYANGNLPTKISFVLLSSCWIMVTYLGYFFIRRGNRIKHGNFLLRSYALTLSAITLRFYAYLMDLGGINLHPVDAYMLLSWISWVPNLAIVEIMIRLGFVRKLAAS